MKTADACVPLLQLLRQEILSGPLVNGDETTLQVLDEPGRAPTTDSYMWVFRGGQPEKPAVEFLYDPTRSSEVAAKYLRGFKGFVQTDGYVGYDFLDAQPGVIHVGCWAHARRKFMDVLKAAGNPSSGVAYDSVERIRQLYAIEKTARQKNLTREELCAVRQELAKPLLESFHDWLSDRALETPPKGLLGKAISYTLQQWHRLKKYIDNGLLQPDNNAAENAIRPFVVGRKNWLFSGTPEGATASAAFYSLIETAKANQLEPYWYLRYVFGRLPVATSEEDYRVLLPQYIDRSVLQQS